MYRALLSLVLVSSLPFSAGFAQSSGERADSSESGSQGVGRSVGFVGGIGVGAIALFSDGPNNTSSNAGFMRSPAGRAVRSSTIASLVQEDGGMYAPSYGTTFAALKGRAAMQYDVSLNSGDGVSSGSANAGDPLSRMTKNSVGVYDNLSSSNGVEPPSGRRPAKGTAGDDGSPMTLGDAVGGPGNIACATGACSVDLSNLFKTKDTEGAVINAQLTVTFNESLGGPTIVNPEPGTIALTLFGLGALGLVHRRNRRNRVQA